MDPNQPSTPGNAHAASSSAADSATNQLLEQAKGLLNQGNLTDLLGQLPQTVKDLGTKASTSYNKLSTTQKVVGGAAILLGVGLLARGGKGKGGKAKKSADTLHELLLFVNDRIEGYKRAVAESQDPQLTGYYKQLVSQSQQFSNELNTYLRQQDGGRETGTTLKGKLYRRFMKAASVVTGHDEKAILAANIHGEQWAIAAYEEAIDDHTLTGSLRQAVERQYGQSQKTYEELKRLAEKHEKH